MDMHVSIVSDYGGSTKNLATRVLLLPSTAAIIAEQPFHLESHLFIPPNQGKILHHTMALFSATRYLPTESSTRVVFLGV
jgi:hypothetical protein